MLSVWYNGGISPGSVDLTRVLEILIIAVIVVIWNFVTGRRAV